MFNFNNLKQKIQERDALKEKLDVRRASSQEVLEKIQNFMKDVPKLMDFCKENGLSLDVTHRVGGRRLDITMDSTDFTLIVDKNNYFDVFSETMHETPPLLTISPVKFRCLNLQDITMDNGYLKDDMKWLYENLEGITNLLEQDLTAEIEKDIEQQRGFLDSYDSLEQCEEQEHIRE